MRGTKAAMLFFFFQAEDGIRDVAVTGVQTCALPILSNGSTAMPGRVSWPRPWAPRSRPIEPSTANETNARRRARIESVPRSESQCHAFLRRHDLGGETLRSCLAAGGPRPRVGGLAARL